MTFTDKMNCLCLRCSISAALIFLLPFHAAVHTLFALVHTQSETEGNSTPSPWEGRRVHQDLTPTNGSALHLTSCGLRQPHFHQFDLLRVWSPRTPCLFVGDQSFASAFSRQLQHICMAENSNGPYQISFKMQYFGPQIAW